MRGRKSSVCLSKKIFRCKFVTVYEYVTNETGLGTKVLLDLE